MITLTNPLPPIFEPLKKNEHVFCWWVWRKSSNIVEDLNMWNDKLQVEFGSQSCMGIKYEHVPFGRVWEADDGRKGRSDIYSGLIGIRHENKETARNWLAEIVKEYNKDAIGNDNPNSQEV